MGWSSGYISEQKDVAKSGHQLLGCPDVKPSVNWGSVAPGLDKHGCLLYVALSRSCKLSVSASHVLSRLMGEHACQVTMLWQGHIHLKLEENIWFTTLPPIAKAPLCLKNELNCLVYAVSPAKSLNWFSLKARLKRPSACQTPNCWTVCKVSRRPRISEGLELFKSDTQGAAGSRVTLQPQSCKLLHILKDNCLTLACPVFVLIDWVWVLLVWRRLPNI